MKIRSNWFIDRDSNYRWIYHKIKRHLLSTRTKFQKIKLIDTYSFGRVVILDNKIQSAEFDEFIYHEALVHPTMITHPEPKNILILGGGEGATLREVLKHPTVKKVMVVDIDEEFVTVCKNYLENWHKNSFDDKKVTLIFTDAMEYIKISKLKFDVIIADISDPVEKGPAQFLYTREFYSTIKRTLKPNGIFVTHATEVQHFPDKSLSSDIVKTLFDIFPVAEFYYEYIPSFGSLWAFTAGSLKYSIKNMPSTTIKSRLKERRLNNLFYYDQETHKRLFFIPKYLRKLFLTG
ncbi:MAG: polyamine aminopropyltransferase [Nitrospirota bacterium]|nr:polyamine aminopropyltransferase [Nitrospirota bacterium]MDH5768981.1 polyamine aminopropyltransferase [Nitrospirota bacterium]